MNTRLIFIFTLIVLCVTIASCPGRGPAEQAAKAVAVNDGGAAAFVTFVSGTVTTDLAETWQPVRIGARVPPARRIKTAAASFCELQVGRLAVVRIEENAEVGIEEIARAANGNRITLRANAGTVLCAVKKLAGADDFRVRTRTAACGVRGTSFAVTVNASGGTVFSVREGKVGVTPAALDLDRLAAAAAGDPEIERLLNALAETERSVGPAQTVTVTAADDAAAGRALRIVEEIMAGGDVSRAADREKLAAAVRQARSGLEKAVAAPGSQTGAERKSLDRLEGLERRLRALPPTGEQPPAEYYAVTVTTKPADAGIYLDGEYLGAGRFEGLFGEGAELKFEARKPGYEPVGLAVEVGPQMAGAYAIELPEPAAFTKTGLPPNVAGEFTVPDAAGDTVRISLGAQRVLLPPGSLANRLTFFPNSGTVLLSRRPFRLLMSVWDDTYLVEGQDLFHLRTAEPVLTRGGPGSIDNGRVSASGIHAHPDGTLYAFYHMWDQEGFENEPRIPSEDFPISYGRIGVASSADGGRTWNKIGPVIGSFKPKEWRFYDGMSLRGVAELSVTRDDTGRYLLLYYSEYSHADGRQIDICLARADLRDGPPLPGSFRKWKDGGFTEPGLGGTDSPVVSAKRLDDADAAAPWVWYSKKLKQYVMVFGINVWKEYNQRGRLDRSGQYIAFSLDGVSWSTPARLIADHGIPMEGKPVLYAASVIPDAGSDTDGWLVYAYSPRFGGEEKNLVPTHLAGRRLSLRKE